MPVDKLTIEQFAQKVKAKYPEYKDVNDSVLVEKMVAKYPEYKEQINYSSTQSERKIEAEPKQPPIVAEKFKPMTDWLNIQPQGYTPMVPENAIVIDDHTKKTAQASDRVNEHIRNIDGSVSNLIYNHKEDLKGRINSIKLGISPKESGPLNPQAAELESKLRQPTSVTNDEIQQFKVDMEQNPGMLRTALTQKVKDLSKTNPGQANQLKGDIYRLDRQGNSEKENKIEKNVTKINEGEIDYDPLRGILYKPHGFFGSLAVGFKQKNQLFNDYNLYTKTGNESAIIKELNSKISEQDPDDPIDMPVGALGEAGAMLGGQPIKPIAGGAIAGYLGTPAAGATAAAAISSHEMYKLGYASALPANYAAIKKQHPDMPDYTAYQQAKELAEKQATVDAVSGAAMGFVGGEAALKPSATPLLQKSVKSALTQIGEEGAKKIMEGIGVGTVGAGGQLIKNLMAQKAGIPVDETEGMAQQLVGGVAMTAGIALLAKSGNLLKPKTKNELLHSISKLPERVIDQEFNNLQEVGYISTEELQAAQKAIRDQKNINSSIDDNIPELDRLKIQAKIKERNLLEGKLDRVDKAYHPEIKEDIKKLNEEIVNISKGADRGELQKLIDKEHKAGNIEGFVTETLRNATEKELDGYFKDISEQARNPETEQATISTFGEKIVNKAKELNPVETEKRLSDDEFVNIFSDIESASLKKGEKAKINALDRIKNKFGELKDKAEFINANFQEIERQLLSSKIIEKICP